MAKKRTRNTSEKRDAVRFCAFWAMAIAALFYIFSGVIKFIVTVFESVSASAAAATLTKLVSIGLFVGNVALIIAVALPAYQYVKGRKKSWRIFYWVTLAVFALGVVFGMLGGIL